MHCLKDLARCVEEMKILSPTSYSFAGRRMDVRNGDTLPKALTATLYEQCYCRGFSGSYQEFAPLGTDAGDFPAALALANKTVTKWDKDWMIDQVLPGGQYLARRNNRYRLVSPGEFITAEYLASMPQPGARITLYCQKEAPALQPSFYFAFSNESEEQPSLFTTVRFYWNLMSSGAVKLMELLTMTLNRYFVPFSFKCLNHPALYARTDAAVLYVTKPYYPITARIISHLYPAIKEELDPCVPWFTKQLDKGLGLAEDPGDGQSFGMSRCNMVALGIYQAGVNRDVTQEEKMSRVEAIFKERGISLDMPYLNSGSIDEYDYHQ